ncbi:TetM/TetW/TetO/TetS family tetracycline resistance ribosomal protection protein [Paraclostridium bifermentans]|uniref:TetM/TetW/TetO/TetS family tetracycline resistance ribosomal protection protein n=1 Tax=Paraclostridium bifermentans TaxID=1490 RepID=A0AA44IHF2_PARBF|nr:MULTISPECIES: TetM/TetW/TetO/TetS family tetracycline resistance ribosomal protection protein [Paraclostridium]MBN8047594.1 TetM/TetW/TetO/TetS family tetracycline resistance ribosomal protection protein [Paraclostridium bifermentans]MBZ6004304.1 TetM/TetW/TetO/TetS family tetracycline resistance ribosomal protection protein [Paraclostridium bifermentans]MDU0296955.1 TetM/TetW/TetO/TetS family tetracycline resistance ribosomal protection protein [Paraclostridium sp. MRS3W1]NME09802.1 TetM/Te
MKKTIGVLAHVDAGKTTFCEQVLYHTKSIKNRGRVDDKNTFLDNHEIEKQRGITIFSEQGKFYYNGSSYNLIDTPGHIDFSPEMERSIRIMDYAVVIISAVEKVQVHTKTVFRLLKKHRVPTFLFINKIDRSGIDAELLLSDIKSKLTENTVDLSDKLNIDGSNITLSEELIEFIAESDEELIERYLNNDYDEKIWIYKLKEKIKKCEIYPILRGSALHDIGIHEFLEKLDLLTYTEYKNDEDFIGKVYKVKYDENRNRITYVKAIRGKMKVKDEISYIVGDDIHTEKINSIRIYNSNKFESINEVEAGQIFGIEGLSEANTGAVLYKNFSSNFYEADCELDMVPTLTSKVIFDKSLNVKEVLSIFQILQNEEPSLNIVWNENLKEIQVNIMGKIQLEVLKEILKSRFGLNIDFGKSEILYKETVKERTIGYGHFEPLGHYAEVHLCIEPVVRNSGIKFKSIAHTDNLTQGHQNLVKTHIFEKEHSGILCGYPVTDIEVTLINGRAHNKHTSGGDFRQATLRALRQGLEQVENEILEPFYKFKIEIGYEYIGRVISDIQKMNGEFDNPIINEDICIIEGRGPVATLIDYPLEIISFSKGSGSIVFIFDGYDVCHNKSEVISNKGYDKDSDIEYTSNSIFCSKGESYTIKGKDAKEFMHCL